MGKSNDNSLKVSIPIPASNPAPPHPGITKSILDEAYQNRRSPCAGSIGKGLWKESIALDTSPGSANAAQDRTLKGKRIVKSTSGCYCIRWKRAIVAAGGVDARLPINEDTELNSRLQQLDALVYTPEAIAHHHTRGAFLRAGVLRIRVLKRHT